MTIIHLLEKNAKKFANDIALIEINPNTSTEISAKSHNNNCYCRKQITWSNFNKQANCLANTLNSLGINKKHKVGILLHNCIEWLPIYFGILKTGALAVPLNYRFSPEEIDYCIKLAEIDVLIFGEEFATTVHEVNKNSEYNCKYIFIGENCPSFADDYNKLISENSNEYHPCELSPENNAAIYFSSGTTGFPKAILLNHKSLMHACKTEQKHHLQKKEDCFLCIPPLYHTGAKMHWFGSLLTGSRAVILKSVKTEDILNTINNEGCTIVFLLVPWVQDILNAIEKKQIKIDEFDLSKWRLTHMGAQHIPESLIKRWHSQFPSQQYDTNYGLSESCGPGALHLGIENIHKAGSIGKAGFKWQTKIIYDNGKTVKTGDVGELCLKGPSIMTCYYNDKKSTLKALKNGWLFTGDLAKEDKDGFIYLVDRKKDIIITGGENLYPVQIENFLIKHPKVKDVAVIGIYDERLGEIAIAIIKTKESMTCTEEEMNDYCMKLPRYKRPKKIFFADIPRNPTGKIEKNKLREIYNYNQKINFI